MSTKCHSSTRFKKSKPPHFHHEIENDRCNLVDSMDRQSLSLAFYICTIAVTAFRATQCTIRTGLNPYYSPSPNASNQMFPNSESKIREEPEESLPPPSTPLDWKSLSSNTFLSLLDPTQYGTQRSHPQMAASVKYAQSILDAWKEQENAWSNEGTMEYTSILYHADRSASSPETPLYGYMVRKIDNPRNKQPDAEPSSVIVLFPTAVGAQDIFLLFRAAQIVNTPSLQHCWVLIVDLFSDSTGWLWDKTIYAAQYDRVRAALLRHDTKPDGGIPNEPYRPLLQNRIRAVLAFVRNRVSNTASLAALGWCFGGHCIAELARMEDFSIRAMITFHGVFSELQLPIAAREENCQKDNELLDAYQESLRRPRKSEILVCHGLQDPFVPSNDLEQALYVKPKRSFFVSSGWNVILTLFIPLSLHVSMLSVHCSSSMVTLLLFYNWTPVTASPILLKCTMTIRHLNIMRNWLKKHGDKHWRYLFER